MLQERDTLAVNELSGISVDDTVQSVQFFLSKCMVGRLDRATQRCRRLVELESIVELDSSVRTLKASTDVTVTSNNCTYQHRS